MSWLRENDDEATDPKTLRLLERGGFEAYYRLHQIRQWSAMHATGGVFTGATFRALGGKARQLAAMVTSGLVDDQGDGVYEVHDWRDYNPTDPTADRRMRAYRSRNADRNEDRNGGRNDDAATGTNTLRSTEGLPVSRPEAVADEDETTASSFTIPDLLRPLE